jgi:integrase
MGRNRKTDKHLPRRVYLRFGTYYFVHPDGKWESLGRELGEAMRRWDELVHRRFAARTLDDLFERYEAEIVPTKATSTQRGNLMELARLRPVFGKAAPDAVTAQHIYAYLDKRSAKVRANREIALLSDVYQKAIRWGVATKNPCKGVERNKERRRERDVQDWEYQAVYALANPTVQVAMDLAVLTGLRQGDILRIRLADIGPDGLKTITGKTGARVIFEMTPGLAETIARAKKLPRRINSLYLLAGRTGQPYTSDGFRAMWQRLMIKAIDRHIITERFTFHDLRAVAASRSDRPRELLTHTSEKQTQTYLRRPKKLTPTR